MSMTEFFTADESEQGVELPLFRPDGTKSDYWLRIRGVDSDEFRLAENVAKRKAALAAPEIKSDEERVKAVMEARVQLASVLVISWNLPDEFTRDNVIMLLRKAPQILDMIDKIAGDRAFFFALRSIDSKAGLSKKSSLPKSRKAAKPR